MCDQAAIHVDLRVSVQLRGAADRVSGHISAGIFGDAHMILVPNPPESLLQEGLPLEVLVVPVAGPPDDLEIIGKIERFVVLKVTGFVLDRASSTGDPDLVALTLDGFSRYGAQLGDFDEPAVAAAFAKTDPDWWAAFVQAEVISDSIRYLSEDFLRLVSDTEVEHYRPRRMDFHFDSVIDIVAATCRPFCKC